MELVLSRLRREQAPSSDSQELRTAGLGVHRPWEEEQPKQQLPQPQVLLEEESRIVRQQRGPELARRTIRRQRGPELEPRKDHQRQGLGWEPQKDHHQLAPGREHRKGYRQLVPGLVTQKDRQLQEQEPASLRTTLHRPRGLEPRRPEHRRDRRQQEQGRASRRRDHRPGQVQLGPGRQIHQKLEPELLGLERRRGHLPGPGLEQREPGRRTSLHRPGLEREHQKDCHQRQELG